MARNVEIKARVGDFAALELAAAGVAEQGPMVIVQDDTFFSCPRGRMKLRVFADGQGQLIHYHRSDEHQPKVSNYHIAGVPEPEALREVLELGYGVVGRVRKTRVLYLRGRTRIHLDRVEGLGDFLELEVVLEPGESEEAGNREARELMGLLGVGDEELVRGAYVDLLRSGSL